MTSLQGTWLRRAAILLPLLATTACASIPNLGAKPEMRSASDYAASASLTPTGAPWPDRGWWLRYGDAQLNQLIEEGIAGSPDVEAAAARFRTAQGIAQQAGGKLAPSVDAFASSDFKKIDSKDIKAFGIDASKVISTGSAGLSFSFDLDLWGKNRAALAAATSDSEAAGYELAQARLALTTGIASTYADLAQLYRQRDTLDRALELRSESLKLVNQRVEIGLDTRAELKQAEGRVADARDDLAANDEAIGLTRNALAALVGKGPDRGLAIQRPSVSTFVAQGIPANATIDLIGRRPDIAAYRASVEANASRIKEAKAAFYPNISITALLGLSAFGIGDIFSSTSSFGSVSPAVTLPLFHGGALQGQYRGARGRYDEAVALYNRQIITALRETADAVTSRRALDARLFESRRALADYEEANSLARKRYERGLSTYLDVLSAEESVLGARLNVAELETRAFELDVALVRALGGGFSRA
ncbi:efflux transporter outer membrane subunit [Sphingomonas sp.]|uniref:efflux transporter outer membrane subunit n=1 Tax=Sphingomonas sp. TaxID=28214 RepID=UPI0025D9EEA1|nr:efflux transporter outer membrane subunit [Sphingomonas sp.]